MMIPTICPQLMRFFADLPGLVDHVLVSGVVPTTCRSRSLDIGRIRRGVERIVLSVQIAYLVKDALQSGGSLLPIGGTGGRRASAGPLISAVTAAMPALARSLALELAPVRVNVIAPGFVDTPLSAAILGDGLDGRANNWAHLADTARRRPRGRRRPGHRSDDKHRRYWGDFRHRRRPTTYRPRRRERTDYAADGASIRSATQAAGRTSPWDFAEVQAAGAVAGNVSPVADAMVFANHVASLRERRNRRRGPAACRRIFIRAASDSCPATA